MPYTIRKRGNKYCLVRKNGTTKQCCDSKAKAKAAARIIMSKEKTRKKGK
ncbi:MAG: hypothetical protein WDA47_04995 [Bacilli bacterium]|jgi:hypothetical protein